MPARLLAQLVPGLRFREHTEECGVDFVELIRAVMELKHERCTAEELEHTPRVTVQRLVLV